MKLFKGSDIMRKHTKQAGKPLLSHVVVLTCVLSGGCIFNSTAWAGFFSDDQVDCEIYETKQYGITVGLAAGMMVFNMSPSVTFTYERGVAWDKVAHEIIARYVELCTRYNAGLVTKEDYDKRIKEIDSLYRKAQEFERQMVEETRARAKDAFKDLDQVFPNPSSKGSASAHPTNVDDQMVNSLNDLASRVNQLEPITRPLKPAKPCPPPDMLGAPGAKC
jgi:hypothetical protein